MIYALQQSARILPAKIRLKMPVHSGLKFCFSFVYLLLWTLVKPNSKTIISSSSISTSSKQQWIPAPVCRVLHYPRWLYRFVRPVFLRLGYISPSLHTTIHCCINSRCIHHHFLVFFLCFPAGKHLANTKDTAVFCNVLLFASSL